MPSSPQTKVWGSVKLVVVLNWRRMLRGRITIGQASEAAAMTNMLLALDHPTVAIVTKPVKTKKNPMIQYP